jgi:hypothetical protein
VPLEKLVQVVFNESTANSLEKIIFLLSNGQKKCKIIYMKGILDACLWAVAIKEHYFSSMGEVNSIGIFISQIK